MSLVFVVFCDDELNVFEFLSIYQIKHAVVICQIAL